jgi:hypothetical protein
MSRVLPARPAELPGFHAFGMLFLIFCGGVVPIFALTTLQRNDFSHFSNSFLQSAGRTEPAQLLKITQ